MTQNSITEFRGSYRWLSNFHLIDVEFEGTVYPSTEHAYQAAKTLNQEVRAQIAKLPSPSAAKKYGSDPLKTPLRQDWDEPTRLATMEMILREKFKDPMLAKLLAGTNNAELVEGNTWGDQFWGISRGSGSNHLGKILMKIRKEIQL